MKHKLTLLASLGIIAAAGISAVNSHRDYIHQITIQDALVAAHQARLQQIQKAQEQASATKAKAQLEQLQTACLDAYNLLTPTQQKRVAQPACVLK